MASTRSAQRNRAIEPFWQRLSQITTYPLQREALFTIVALAVMRLVVYVPLLGWLLDLFVLIAILRYAGEVLYRTAHGRMDPPAGYSADDSRGWTLFWVLLALVLLALFGGLVAAAVEAPWVGTATIAVIALVAPGAMISAAIDGDWQRALNPTLWLQVMLRLGAPYLLLAVLCVMILLSEANTQAFMQPLMPGPFAVVMSGLISHYALVASFHLMGYVVYQYHEVLEFAVDARMAPLARRDDVDAELLAQSQALAADGDLAAAETILREHIRERGGSDAVRARHRKLLRMRGDTAALLADGREWINMLIAREHERRALEVWRECRELDPGFWPSDPALVLRLAQTAAALGLSELALKSTSGFHKAFPKHADIVPNYLLAARLLVDRYGRDAQALELLRGLERNYPQHPLAAEIAAYATVVEGLVASAAPKRTT